MQQLMTIKEYAQLKRISENTVRRRIDCGEIAVERFGRAVRIIPSQAISGFELVDLPSYLAEKTISNNSRRGQANG